MSKQKRTAFEALLIDLGLKPGMAMAIARTIDRIYAQHGGSDDLAARFWLRVAAAEQAGYDQGQNEPSLWAAQSLDDWGKAPESGHTIQ